MRKKLTATTTSPGTTEELHWGPRWALWYTHLGILSSGTLQVTVQGCLAHKVLQLSDSHKVKAFTEVGWGKRFGEEVALVDFGVRFDKGNKPDWL